MKHSREESADKRRDRSERDPPARKAATLPSTVLDARGLSFDGLGNRALLSLLRSGRLQRKARISQPNDPREHEADRAADAVVAGVHTARPADSHSSPTAIQRAPADSAAGPAPVVGTATELYGGHSLDRSTRDLMESRFGESFGEVRIHTGHRAAETAAALESRAFTVGQDIVFGAGQFAPETSEGQRLLAHELAHVVQQRQTAGPIAGAKDTEHDARDAAHQVTAGGTPSVRERAAPGTVQKQEHGEAAAGGASTSADAQPRIVRIDADWHSTTGKASLSGQGTETVALSPNDLPPGTYTLRKIQDPKYAYRIVSGPKGFEGSLGFLRPAEYPQADTVTVRIWPTAKQRIDRLPPYIQAYLNDITSKGGLPATDQEKAEWGEDMLRRGATAADVAATRLPEETIEVHDSPDPDFLFVEKARHGRYSQLAGFGEFKKDLELKVRLAKDWARANGLNPPDPLEGAEWIDDPVNAAKNWDDFETSYYRQAVKTEAVTLKETGRRAEMAQNAWLQALALSALLGTGAAGAGPALGLLARFRPVAWLVARLVAHGFTRSIALKTVNYLVLSYGLTSGVTSAYEEAQKKAKDTGVELFSIKDPYSSALNLLGLASAGVLKVTGATDVYEAATDESLVTGDTLGRSYLERIFGGAAGAFGLGMTGMGVRDWAGSRPWRVKPPDLPPEAPSGGAATGEPVTVSNVSGEAAIPATEPPAGTEPATPSAGGVHESAKPVAATTGADPVSDVSHTTATHQGGTQPVAPPTAYPPNEIAAMKAAKAAKAVKAKAAAQVQAAEAALAAKQRLGAIRAAAGGTTGPGSVEVGSVESTATTSTGADRPSASDTIVQTDLGKARKTISTVGPDGTVHVQFGEKSTTISLTDKKGNNMKLARDLDISTDEARQVLQDVRIPTRKTLISFAIDKRPVAFLKEKLRDPSGFWESDAFERPPAKQTRVDARQGRPGEKPLSEYALVFEEEIPGQYTPKTSKTTPVTEYQFVDPVTGQRITGSRVWPKAVVRVNDSGVIVEIVDHVIPGTPAEAQAKLIELFQKQGWKVDLQ